MRLLAIDPALACGIAFGDGKSTPHSTVVRLPGFEDRKRAGSFASMYSTVMSLTRANGIEGLIIEAPLHLGGKSAHTERVLTMLSGAAQAGAINGGARFVEVVAPPTWRKAVLGQGFPKDAKNAALEYCRLIGSAVTDHNCAEAICLLQYGHGLAKVGRFQ